MKEQRLSSIIYLLFSISVAFYNIYLGHLWVSFFVVPFIIPVITCGKVSKISELIALSLTSICALIFMDIMAGIIFSLLLDALVYSLTINKKINYGCIILQAIMVFCFGLINSEESYNTIMRSLLYVGIFIMSASVFHVYIAEIRAQTNKDRLDKKYMQILEELYSVAHESIDTLKKIQEETNDDIRKS